MNFPSARADGITTEIDTLKGCEKGRGHVGGINSRSAGRQIPAESSIRGVFWTMGTSANYLASASFLFRTMQAYALFTHEATASMGRRSSTVSNHGSWRIHRVLMDKADAPDPLGQVGT